MEFIKNTIINWSKKIEKANFINLLINKNKKRKGFTLIEVMVTVTIIGIISSIAMVSYSGAQKKAKENVDYATAANIATAAQMAMADGKTSISIDSLKSDGYLQTTPKSKQNPKQGFAVTVDTENEKVTVSLGDETMYPRD